MLNNDYVYTEGDNVMSRFKEEPRFNADAHIKIIVVIMSILILLTIIIFKLFPIPESKKDYQNEYQINPPQRKNKDNKTWVTEEVVILKIKKTRKQ
jgi:hypothetical protein